MKKYLWVVESKTKTGKDAWEYMLHRYTRKEARKQCSWHKLHYIYHNFRVAKFVRT